MGGGCGPGAMVSGVGILLFLRASSLTLGKLFNLPNPPFFHLESGDKILPVPCSNRRWCHVPAASIWGM